MVKAIRTVSKMLHLIGTGLVGVLMFYGTADVVGRYFFNSPVKWTYELSQILLAIIVFLGWAYTLYEDKHTTIGLVYSRFPPKVKKTADIFTRLLALIVFALITWQAVAWAIVYIKANRHLSGIFLPLYPFQMLVAFGALMICLELIIQIFSLLFAGADESSPRMQEGS